MKAVRLYAAGDLRVEDIPAPAAPGPGWVRLEVTAAGICGSDLHNYRTGQWISRAPSVAGHELTGVVAAVGEGVSGFQIGDHVVADSRFWCGECAACRSGQRRLCERLGFIGELCDGGFAEQTVLPARLLALVPRHIAPAMAAMAEPLAVALHAVRRLAPRRDDAVIVVGCGPIGGLAALLLSRLHDGPLLLVDRNAERANLVGRVTGGRVVALEREALIEAQTGPRSISAIEATGSLDALGRLIETIGGGGRIALVGISHGGLNIEPNVLVERELTLLGCHVFENELGEAIGLLSDLAPDLARLIDREIELGEVPAAYERLMAGGSAGLKTIIRMGA